MPIDPAVALMCRWLLAFVFASAAWHKLARPRRFRDTVAAYGLLPGALVTPLAAGLVVLECMTVIALLVPPLGPAGAGLAGALLLIYTASIAINLVRGRTRIDCGCTGFMSEDGQLTGGLLARNLPLVCVAFYAAQPVQPRDLDAWDVAVALCAALAFGLLYASVNHLLVNSPRLRALVSRHD